MKKAIKAGTSFTIVHVYCVLSIVHQQILIIFQILYKESEAAVKEEPKEEEAETGIEEGSQTDVVAFFIMTGFC